LVARLRDAFQVDLPLAALFGNPTVEGVVAELRRAWGSQEILEEVARAVMQVEDLSEEEVDALIAQ
jgi:hypothetical protein